MKKLLAALVLVMVVASLAWGGSSSWTITQDKSPSQGGVPPTIKTWSAMFTASGSDGNVTSYTHTTSDIAFFKDYYIYNVEVVSGTPNPTALWDITVVDANGMEICSMSDFAADAKDSRYCANSNGRWYPPRDGTALTIGVSGNSVAGAKATLKFWLAK